MNTEPDEPSSEKLKLREQWSDFYLDRLENHSLIEPPRDGEDYLCPCCRYKTLSERGGYEICAVCFWEDDGQDEQDADGVRGGPNGSLNLAQARANYRGFGACERRHVKHVRLHLAEEF